MKSERLYKIGDVATMLDIAPSMIRSWQKWVPELAPKYINKQRRYTDSDIEQLKLVKRLVLEKGFFLPKVREIILSQANRKSRPKPCKNNEDAVKYLRKAKVALADNIKVALMLDEVEKYISNNNER